MTSNPSLAKQWPPNYRAHFWSDRLIAYQVALILAALGMVKSFANLIITLAVIVGAVGAGGLIGALQGFQAGWLYAAAIPLIVAIAGAVTAVISFPRRTALYDQYRPGTEARIVVADGRFVFSANLLMVRHELAELISVRRFGALSALQFANKRYVVIPTKLIPHWPDPTKEPDLNRRWRRPPAE